MLASELGKGWRRDARLLVGLQLRHLKSIEWLAVNVWLLEEHLALCQLHELRLLELIEALDAVHRLSIDGATVAMARLERLSSRGLVHLEIAHVLALVRCGVVWLTPVLIQ
jgi:hypothetical protein